ncbi:Phage integrase [Pseudomonas chlororaphis subsp. aurantiaca]|nr:Phage integrase [Pseudomonas chlororaphis subsp. aurantiaca]
MKYYPTLFGRHWNYNTLNVIDITDQLPLVDEIPLDPHALALNAQEAAAAFVAAGTAANTVRSYRSALAYWSAWLQLRYGQTLGDAALPPTVAVQFVVDHLARPLADGNWTHLLPPSVDAALVAARVKAKPGPLAFSTVSHRLAVLGKWHRLNAWDSPTEAPVLKTLLRDARKAQSRQGITVRKKTAVVVEPLQALLATCTDGVRGVRDRALLLLAWSGGGRRRSEVVGLQIGDVRKLDADTWLYALGATKTDTGGVRREKPLRGPAAQALSAWLAAAPASAGPLFRRLHKGGKVGATGLSADQVARIVQRRAQLAGLEGDWAAHSLRSGFVTEASRQGVPLGEVMAMTEHRSVTTVMRYFQAGALLSSRATDLLPSSAVPATLGESSNENREKSPPVVETGSTDTPRVN